MSTPTLEVRNPTVADLIDKEFRERRGMDEIVMRFTNSLIVRALTLQEGNVSHAAILLNIDRNELVRWMLESGIAKHFPVDDD